MSKNDLQKGVNLLLGDSRPVFNPEDTLSDETREALAKSRAKEEREKEEGKKRPGRPKKEVAIDEVYFRTTIIAHRQNYEKLRVISMKLGVCFKDILNAALAAAVENYEEKNGEIVLREKNLDNPFK